MYIRTNGCTYIFNYFFKTQYLGHILSMLRKCAATLHFKLIETGFSCHSARRQRVPLNGGAEEVFASFEMRSALNRWWHIRDGELVDVALSGQPGQVGA